MTPPLWLRDAVDAVTRWRATPHGHVELILALYGAVVTALHVRTVRMLDEAHATAKRLADQLLARLEAERDDGEEWKRR